MDVLLHYRVNEGNLDELVDIAERALEDFPHRVLPLFTPWFPSGSETSLPFKPRKSPPVVSAEDLKRIQFYLWCSERSSRGGGEAEDLREFSTADLRRSLPRQRANSEFADATHHDEAAATERRPRRSWSVVSLGGVLTENIRPFSGQFQMVVERLGLHSLQRAKWIIGEFNCVASDLEHVWTVLIQAMRQSKLPTCNANIQRQLAQIWVFCDVLYCEYVGHFLKQEFQLSGQISLTVHKQGTIFSL
ncbi:shieldin complex subunit 3 [Megalops cyprinoides]|uniref:shieldin complex subunit 3 n=1 Tax=Megalops cyprinoides TaxID=118141 RepID=UPI001863DCCE|nr:shieldin complex subunit 3 [Megalops cyprinoides]